VDADLLPWQLPSRLTGHRCASWLRGIAAPSDAPNSSDDSILG
jgi:hypothetical protein